jgi:hypothetical protein
MYVKHRKTEKRCKCKHANAHKYTKNRCKHKYHRWSIGEEEGDAKGLVIEVLRKGVGWR